MSIRINNIDYSNQWMDWIKNAVQEKHIDYYKFEYFSNFQVVGAGVLGKVYRANWKRSNKFVALKSFFNLNNVTVKEICNELKLHREVECHNNIIRFYGITKSVLESESDKSKQYLFVLEYADGGSLQSYLRNNFQTLTWDNKFNLAHQLASAILCLHSKGILHRDLHSKNIFVHQNVLKLGDFGLSKRIDEGSNITSQIFGVIPYIDPRVFNSQRDERYRLNEKSDIYSVGVLLWEISSGQPPFHAENESYDISLALAITRGLREKPVINTPVEYAGLYTECWDDEPEHRPAIRQVATRLKTLMMSQTYLQVLDVPREGLLSSATSLNEQDINSSNLFVDNLSIIVNGIVDLLIRIINEGRDQSQRRKLVEDYIIDNNSSSTEVVNWTLNNQDYSNCVFLLGYFHLFGIEISQNDIRALDLFIKASKQDNSLAHYYVGECYQYGCGTPINEQFALECYQIVASKNFTAGQYAVGYFYENGISIERNERMAIYWYKKAANNGHLIALYNLGICYIYGQGIVRDYEIAFEYFKQSADREYVKAISMLGYCYSRGIGTNFDKQKAFELYQKASNLGVSIAQYSLAEMYWNGDGVAINIDQAIYWYKKSAENGYAKAKVMLNELNLTYETSPGKYSSIFIDEIVKTIIKIADVESETEGRKEEILDIFSNNNVNSEELCEWLLNNQDTFNNIFLLGYFYYTKIVTKNIKSAFKLFNNAADQNHILAHFFVGKCYQYGYETTKDDKLAFKYYHKVAINEYAIGQVKLAFYYKNGIYVEENNDLALDWFERAANLGNPVAAYQLGLCYYNGIGTRKDYTQAFKLFKKSADDGNVDGMAKLGYCYQMGIGTNVVLEKAFELYQKASYLGKDSAQYYLANMYENGDWVKKDINQAIHWYTICVENGFQLAKEKLRLLSDKEGFNRIADEIVDLYLKSALNNDDELDHKKQNILGHISKNRSTANKLAEWLSNNQNTCNNIFLLGYLKYEGIGINKDNGQAFKLFKIAAEQNHVLSQLYIGMCYQFGYGTVKNDRLAFKYFQKVADQDFAAGQANIGYFYENGIGVEKNEKNAVHWYKKAVNNRNISAFYNLGYCYLYGKGIEKDYEVAFELFKRSAENGYVFGITMLGYCYQTGRGTNVDKDKAFEFYLKAANFGSSIAQHNLANMYLNEGKDIDQAIYWLRKAVKSGCKESQKKLNDLLEYRV